MTFLESCWLNFWKARGWFRKLGREKVRTLVLTCIIFLSQHVRELLLPLAGLEGGFFLCLREIVLIL